MQGTELMTGFRSAPAFPAPPNNFGRNYEVRELKKQASQSARTGAFGSRMAMLMGLSHAPAITVKTRRGERLAVTRLRCDTGVTDLPQPIPNECAFLVNLHLREVTSHKWRLRGRSRADGPYSRGATNIVNLEDGPATLQSSPFDCLQFYVPRAVLDEIADDNGARRIDTLTCPLGKIDPVINQLGSAILDVMEMPGLDRRLFLDHAVQALVAHFARIYGAMRIDCQPVRGGLAPWQVRRSTEMLLAHLDGDICLIKVARECELSVSYFVRAFKQTIGLPPYRWLTEQRIEVAKNLLLHSAFPMVDIANKCGFTDQACFIRAFKRTTEMTPGEWRRTRRS
jgi:AraC family transcriptional regulator